MLTIGLVKYERRRQFLVVSTFIFWMLMIVNRDSHDSGLSYSTI
jgi:hypothetical protein